MVVIHSKTFGPTSLYNASAVRVNVALCLGGMVPACIFQCWRACDTRAAQFFYIFFHNYFRAECVFTKIWFIMYFPFFPFLKACFICKESVLSFNTTFLFIYFITLNVSYILRKLCFCIFLMCRGRLLTSCHTSAHCCSRGNSAGPRGSVWPGVWRLVTVAGILWFLVL